MFDSVHSQRKRVIQVHIVPNQMTETKLYYFPLRERPGQGSATQKVVRAILDQKNKQICLELHKMKSLI